jgi:putative holliday junction resolvase
MHRYLCLDYGEKRIGIAISDPFNMTAQPLPFVPNSSNKFTELKLVIEAYTVETIVLGLPLNLKGEYTHKTREVMKFKTQIEENLKRDVVMQDERFSTKAVEKFLISAKVSRKKRKTVIDSHAAAYILQGFLDANTK